MDIYEKIAAGYSGFDEYSLEGWHEFAEKLDDLDEYGKIAIYALIIEEDYDLSVILKDFWELIDVYKGNIYEVAWSLLNDGTLNPKDYFDYAEYGRNMRTDDDEGLSDYEVGVEIVEYNGFPPNIMEYMDLEKAAYSLGNHVEIVVGGENYVYEML